MFCDVDLGKYAPENRQRHYDGHLSSLDTLRARELHSFLVLANLYTEYEQHPRVLACIHDSNLHTWEVHRLRRASPS